MIGAQLMPLDSLRQNQQADEWSERADHWIQATHKVKPRLGRAKRKERHPLVLTGHGVRLRINGGSLEVCDGFTHYPQKRREWRFFRGDADRPSRIVLVDVDGSTTFDVLAWLAEQEIPLSQVDWRGRAIALSGGGLGGADPGLEPVMYFWAAEA